MRTRLLSFLKNRIGLDRAIAVSSLTQLMRFVTGPITMVLMIRHFSPEEQGFYYSFGGVLGLQVFLEAGFAQSITQFTSKEFASLRFNSKDFLVGSPAALSRLRSLFNQANLYYRAMAAVLAVCLSFGGYWFFSTKPDHGVPWMLPWFVVCITSSIAFLLTPFWAFLEGCNRVAQVATYRLWSTFGMFLIVATGLMLDFGIYVVVWAAFFNLVFPICYLGFRWRPLIVQILRPPRRHHISWRRDVWGFQWRIALSWMARYSTDAAITPLVFACAGAAQAGRVGMTIQLLRIGALVASNWSGTKLPYLGSLLGRGEFAKFETQWKYSSKRHISLGFGIQLLMISGLIALISLFPSTADRFVSPAHAVFYSLSFAVASLMIVMFHYTRADRSDPLYIISVSSAILFLALAITGTSFIGPSAVGISLLLARMIAVFTGYPIWKKYRKSLKQRYS
jgi:O-antigen/teichoic acid export membrane protein